MYEQRPSRIPGAFVWRGTSDGSPTRVLPDGCLDLLWSEGTVRIAGPDTRAALHRSAAGTEIVGLRFAPGFGPRVLGAPADAFTDDHVPLGEVWTPAAARRLEDRLQATADPGTVLEDVAALVAARSTGPETDRIAVVAEQLRAGRPVEAVADEVGLSVRQLHRRSLEAFGYGPKLLTRILRLQDALALAHEGLTFAQVAARAGYADQAHLSRNVKDLAGVPLGQLLAPPSPRPAPSGSGANRSTPFPSGSSTEA